MKAKLLGALILTGLLFTLPNRCRVCEAVDAASAAVIVATSPPVAAMARLIAGDALTIVDVVPPGTDPRTWAPTGESLIEISKARLILLNGAGLERWATDAPLPPERVIDTSRRFAETLILRPDGELAACTWLDPRRAISQGREVKSALAETFPSLAASFEEGFAALERDLTAIDTDLANLELGEVAIDAPAEYTYLLDRYEWPRDETMSRRLRLTMQLSSDERDAVFFDIASDVRVDESWIDRLRANVERMKEATRRP